MKTHLLAGRKLVVLSLLLLCLIGGFVAWRALLTSPKVVATLEGESMTLSQGTVVVFNPTASGGQVAQVSQAGSATSVVDLPKSTDVIHMKMKNTSADGAYSNRCRNEWRKISLIIDGVSVLSDKHVIERDWSTFLINHPLSAGSHTISISYDNTTAVNADCDRHLSSALDLIEFVVQPETTSVGAIGSLSMVRPLDHPVTSSSATIKGVAGSFESFQVVVDSGSNGDGISGVNISTSGSVLSDGSGHSIPASKFTIYREGYTTISLPSDDEIFTTNPCNANCRVPDALIPKVDYIYNEPRNAFPITVPAGENRVGWIDVQIPAGQAPGTYTGVNIVVTSNGTTLKTIPVELTVYDFDMPATSSLGGGIGISTGRICTSLGIYPNCTVGSGIPSNITGGAWQVYRDYARVALENRASLARPGYYGPNGGNLPSFQTYAEPLLDGTATRTPGQAITDIFLNNAHASLASAWKTEGENHNPKFSQKISFYCDEFNNTEWQSACGDGYDIANTSWQSASPNLGSLKASVIGNMAKLNAGRSGNITAANNTTTLIPIVNHMDPYNSGSTRADYDTFADTPGNRLWMYTSCMSVGCGTEFTPGAVWTGFPVLSGIDQPPSAQRAMGWQNFNYKVTGDYYFESLQNISKCTNWNIGTPPINCMFNEGGNGDGTLFYPGYTSQVGGTHDIPIESIRLKRYRDGKQDYELLKYLSEQCKGSCPSVTEAQVRSISGGPNGDPAGMFPTLSQSNVTQTFFDNKRNLLLSLLP